MGVNLMTEFIMLVGLPASGKSTYAEKLKEKEYHIHSSDSIREELTGDAKYTRQKYRCICYVT